MGWRGSVVGGSRIRKDMEQRPLASAIEDNRTTKFQSK